MAQSDQEAVEPEPDGTSRSQAYERNAILHRNVLTTYDRIFALAPPAA